MAPSPTPPPLNVAGLPAEWRARAEELRRYAAEPQAAALEECAEELERALRDHALAAITLAEAAAESGFTADYVGRLVRAGKLLNVGRAHAPRVRRGDLPRKAGALRPGAAESIDRAHLARSVANSSKERRDG